MAREKAANRRATDRQASADGSVEEMLREIGADILDEPVPERLLRLLRATDGSGGSPEPRDTRNGMRGDRASDGHQAQRRDGESCG